MYLDNFVNIWEILFLTSKLVFFNLVGRKYVDKNTIPVDIHRYSIRKGDEFGYWGIIYTVRDAGR